MSDRVGRFIHDLAEVTRLEGFGAESKPVASYGPHKTWIVWLSPEVQRALEASGKVTT